MTALSSLSLTAIPAGDEALRQPVREFLIEAMRSVPAHIRARSWAGYSSEFSKALAKKVG
jgi:hypothetical protein